MPQMRLVMKWASRGSLPFMKMLYPRKIDEVLWHSAAWRLSKSILVKIPRLPTIRVIGSQFISTSFLEPVGVPFAADVIVPIFFGSFFSTLRVDSRWSVRCRYGATSVLYLPCHL